MNDTDQARLDAPDAAVGEAEGWDDVPTGAAGSATYPEYSYSLADHVYTWSPKLPDGSMMVIRAQTAEGVAEAAEALVAVAGRLRAAWQGVLGTPPQAPQGPAQGYQAPPMPAPQGNTPPPFGPNVSVPQAPGYQGPPAAPQQQWGAPPAAPQPSQEYRQAGWYKLTVPYPKKADFDGLCAQYQFRKGRPSEGGQFSWSKGDKSWYVAADIAGAFGQFQPVPA